MCDESIALMALPKGRMEKGVLQLLADAGIEVLASDFRTYRPSISIAGVDLKVLKPQNIIEMLESGSRDFGFAGADWVAELEANVIELLDTDLDPVDLVVAAPASSTIKNSPHGNLRIASEYERLSKKWIFEQGLEARFIRSFGATEVFPPEDADYIIDNTATGVTLRSNGLVVIDKLLSSSTKLYANPRALENLAKRAIIENFVIILKSVLTARSRVLLEMNVDKEGLERMTNLMPGIKNQNISILTDAEYAIKITVMKKDLPTIIPLARNNGATDIVVTSVKQIVV